MPHDATSASSTRPAAVAGLFYPEQRDTLTETIEHFLVPTKQHPALAHAKAFIIPHAGYIYSAPVAAPAYSIIAANASTIRRVVLLGPCHRVAVRGMAVPSTANFATPLGNVSLDQAAIAQLHGLPSVTIHDGAHAEEHSLEVHLPFLQTILPSFTLIPLAVGDTTATEIAEVLERLWGGEDTIIIISSDLSHFMPYTAAQNIDSASVNDILRLIPLTDYQQACGALPINGLLEVARQRKLTPHLLDLRNSGDTAGDRTRVVGYASIAFTEAEHA
ncbi:AmmeMemoRadiSam system protein B [Chrysiogenes arsenatis]|uniref:AmmeMemoRadiSam system protein B n=1 Tax=Chrysiogenes arsenatis TaxID=309797 RepID=UPI0003F5C6A8|nr:AmmeMemoRadiSam system protein B [Chrysiogenes arsenatis]